MANGGPRTRAFGASAAAAAAAGVFAAVALAAPDRSVETDTGTLGAGTSTELDAECKSGSHATGAGFQWTPQNQFDMAVRPAVIYPQEGLREWFVYLDNESGTTRPGKVWVLCRKGKRLQFKAKDYALDSTADQTPTMVARCPRGSSVAGGGGLVNGMPGSSAIVASRPISKREWQVDVFLYEDDASLGIAIAMCDRENRYRRDDETAQADSFPRARRTNFDTVSATARCPRGSTTSAGGFELDDLDPNASPLASAPEGKGKWTATARYGGRTDPEVTSYVVCRVR